MIYSDAVFGDIVNSNATPSPRTLSGGRDLPAADSGRRSSGRFAAPALDRLLGSTHVRRRTCDKHEKDLQYARTVPSGADDATG
jgi:hypothetical protein